MPDMDPPDKNWSVSQIAQDVNAGVRSAVSVMREALARARAYDEIQPQVWISRATDSELLAQAAGIDRQVADGESLELAGVPVAVKDNIDVTGFATTAGCPQ